MPHVSIIKSANFDSAGNHVLNESDHNAERMLILGVAAELSTLSLRLRMAADAHDWRKVDTILCDIESAERMASKSCGALIRGYVK